jgi:hypothetical protein
LYSATIRKTKPGSEDKGEKMLLHIREDIHGYIYEPHSTQLEYFYTTLEGNEALRNSGWKPYVMHRVSRYLHESLLIDEWLVHVSIDVTKAVTN